jgi:hypothetical protein
MKQVVRNLAIWVSVAAMLFACDGVPSGVAQETTDTPETTDTTDVPDIIVTHPRNLSWANIDTDGDGIGENYITSVKSQPCNDCYLYAAIALVEARWQIDHKVQVSLNLSEQNVHNCMKVPCDGAGDLGWMLNYIQNYGVMPEENMPTGFWL